MTKQMLTPAEAKYLSDLKSLPTSIQKRALGWALELLPAIGLFTYGFNAHSRFFMTAGFLTAIYFALWRMYGQYRGARLLANISSKLDEARADTDG